MRPNVRLQKVIIVVANEEVLVRQEFEEQFSFVWSWEQQKHKIVAG